MSATTDRTGLGIPAQPGSARQDPVLPELKPSWWETNLRSACMTAAHGIILDLKKDYRTLLGKTLLDCHDRSGRQWQRNTAVLTTHRLANIVYPDRTMPLDDGVVGETRTHAELVARGGLFARLFCLQTADYRPAALPTTGASA